MRKVYKFTAYPFILLVLSLTIIGCSKPLEVSRISETPAETQTQAPPTSTATDIPPTYTATAEPTTTPTPTSTNTPTQTPTQTPTPTPEPAVLTFSQDSVCMTGASFAHNVNHYVTTGTTYPILGQLEDHSWWLVEADTKGPCWAFEGVAEVSGEISIVPVITPPPLPTETPTAQPSTKGVYYILIDKDSGGPFGCGDSLIKWYPGVWVKGGMEDDIKGALNALFANHSQYTNGLYNPIYKSELKAKSVEVIKNDVVVYLAGKLVKPKDQCESQRMHDQIWYTVSQFSPTRAVIYLNNALLGDLLVVSNK